MLHIRKRNLALTLAAVCFFYIFYKGISRAFEVPPIDPVNPSNVSFVYTWVNGSDLAHLRLKQSLGGHAEPTMYDRTIDELMFSLRSIEKYLSWYEGNIYIVSPGQTPYWLNTSHPRIHVVDQATLLPDEANPTCNSFLIEFYLDLIPGLTDAFVYLNDDYFFVRPVSPSRFFDSQSRGQLYPNSMLVRATTTQAEALALQLDERLKTLGPGGDDEHWDLWHAAMMLSAVAAFKVLRLRIRTFWHLPFVWHKEVLVAARTDFADYLKEMYHHPFRNQRDIQAPSILYAEYVNLHRRTWRQLYNEVPSRETYEFALTAGCSDNDAAQEDMFAKIRSGKYDMFNLNSDYHWESSGRRCRAFLEELFDTPSSFEIQGHSL